MVWAGRQAGITPDRRLRQRTRARTPDPRRHTRARTQHALMTTQAGRSIEPRSTPGIQRACCARARISARGMTAAAARLVDLRPAPDLHERGHVSDWRRLPSPVGRCMRSPAAGAAGRRDARLDASTRSACCSSLGPTSGRSTGAVGLSLVPRVRASPRRCPCGHRRVASSGCSCALIMETTAWMRDGMSSSLRARMPRAPPGGCRRRRALKSCGCRRSSRRPQLHRH